jgi:hypothetical protein
MRWSFRKRRKGLERRAALLCVLAQAADTASRSEVIVAAAQPRSARRRQPSLDRDEQQRLVTTPNPRLVSGPASSA